jgi:hypothetical protein
MTTVTELLKTLEKVDPQAIAVKVFNKNKKFFIMLNQGQLLKGKRRTGAKVGTYKSGEYARWKKETVSAVAGFGNVDVKVTGAFYKGLNPFIEGEDVSMESTDQKAPDLEQRYSEEMYGLDDKNIKLFREVAFRPDYLAEFCEQTGLTAE